MKPFLKNILIGFAVLISIVGIGTCAMNKNSKGTSPPILSDTSFVTKWKAEKESQLKEITFKLSNLETKNDSLANEVSLKKKQLFISQFKSKEMEIRLKNVAKTIDSSGLYKDNLSLLVDSVTITQMQSDSTCNQTVNGLEQIIANRDSSIILYKNESTTLRDMRKEQADREQLLTEQLNTMYKEQRKIVVRGKLISGGLVLLSAFAGALLINQILK